MTSDKLLKDILQNQLNLDCTTLSITRKSQDGSVSSFCGPGFISQNIEGGLKFKIYCKGVLDPKVYLSQMNNFTSGKLIEENQLYKLEATDMHGHQIEAHSIIPRFNGGAEIEGYTVSGDCSKIFGTSDRSVTGKGTLIKIYYKNKFKISSNTTNQTEITIGKEKRGRKFELSGAQFDTEGFDFEILSEDDCTILVIFTEKTIDPVVIAQRANEALHFVLAQNEQMVALAIDHEQSKYFISKGQGINLRLQAELSLANNSLSFWI